MDKFIIWGSYCENPIEKRIPFRDEHLDRLSRLKDEGILITLGPTKCNKFVFGIFEYKNQNDLKALLREDIYWREGIWTDINIYSWNQVF